MGPGSRHVVRKGVYWRAHDARWISRFRCHDCGRTFSSSRWTAAFGQKKRKLNLKVRDLLVSGVSLRRTARLLKINRKTVDRKFLFLAHQAKLRRLEYLEAHIELYADYHNRVLTK